MIFTTKKRVKARTLMSMGMLVVLLFLFAVAMIQIQVFKNKLLNQLIEASAVSDSNVSVRTKTDDGKLEKKLHGYVAASTEGYIMNNFEKLGFNIANKNAEGCPIWKNPNVSTQENFDNLQAYVEDIDNFSKVLADFDATIPNLVETVRRGGSSLDQKELCKAVRPHPDGIQALFPSKQLSLSPRVGYIEPLLTPMRHPKFCTEGVNLHNLLRLDYIIHDFEQMCLNLKPHSKSVLVDMGASLKFHGKARFEPPIMTLLKSYEKFGFYFDHIYAAEVKEFDPKQVFHDLLPEKYFPSYHWINTGISADKESKLNLLRSIVSKFDKDDLVVVKLDIDTNAIEVPLAYQLLEDDSINKVVDHFYFEHHVHIKENSMSWVRTMKGSMQDTFELMNGIRKKGVAAHFWV